MKIKYTEKGTSLIILVIIIVVVGILGTGLVSIMGAKQRAYPVQAQSYQALNLANAGIEFAIRYGAEDISRYNTSGGVLRSGMTVNFGNGSFTVTYLNNPPDYTLKSVGVCGNAKREVRLKGYPGYAMLPTTGGGTGIILTKIPDPTDPPEEHSKTTNIPITNLFNKVVYIKKMEITFNPEGGSKNLIDTIKLGNQTIYDAADDTNNRNRYDDGDAYYTCIPKSDSVGTCYANNKCENPMTPLILPWDYTLPTSAQLQPGGNIQDLVLTSGSIKGEYTIKFYFDFDPTTTRDDLNLQVSTMKFTVPPP